MNEDIWIPIAGMIFTLALFIGTPLAILYARRMWNKPQAETPPPEVLARLERIEQAVESIAVEVERISEGPRFTTKLLAERGEPEKARALPPKEPGR